MTTPVEPISLSASLEDYLEAICQICSDGGVARMRDIARKLNVSTPSANAAVTRLGQAGLVSHQRYEYVQLTDRGKRYAERIVGRHQTLRRFLTQVLGVSPEVAEHDACQLEHGVSPETTERLVNFMESMGSGEAGVSEVTQESERQNPKSGSGEPGPSGGTS